MKLTLKKLIVLFSSIGLILCAALIILILWFNGVIVFKKTITAQYAFHDLKTDPTRIEIECKNDYIGTFVIDSEEQINEICNLIRSYSYTLASEDLLPPGMVGESIKLIYDDNTFYSMKTNCISYRNNLYYTDSWASDLTAMLYEIGIERGALAER